MSKKRALIIDDEPDIRELLEITLIRMGIDTASADTVSEAKQLLEEQDFHLCLTDMNLPDGDGIDLVAYIQTHFANTPVAMITAYGSVETAICALKAGAFDFISKPVDLSQLRGLVNTALKLSEASEPARLSNTDAHSLIKGETEAIQTLNIQVAKLARSQAPIYISGESGSGKELVARMIHQQGPRANGPFVPVNCGAIPAELMESEFFGHKKGSFSGAIEDKIGLFRAAEGGTLFLDEIADLPLGMQVKLLRVIQEKAVRPIGEQQEFATDVRILSATHKELGQLVDSGEFRQDLFYRINVIKLDVPSLRERQEDIPLLANHFLASISQQCHIENARFEDSAMDALMQYHFPGNVRELENIIERAFTLCEHNCIDVQDLQLSEHAGSRSDPARPQASHSSISSSISSATSSASRIVAEHGTETLPATNTSHRAPNQSLEDYLEGIERAEIETALAATKWNRTAAAKLLGISFRALRYRLKKLGMD
jgi:two-component system response regulator PilR (NtrC family)